jgi:hypothetical protein
VLETFDGRTNSQRLLERAADAKRIIDKFDKISGQMKNWFITSLIALTGVSVLKDQPKFLFLNVVLVIAFYVAEVGYRLAHDAFLARTRKIEAILRSECEFTTEHMPPHLDKYLLHGREEWFELFRQSKRHWGN